MRLVKLASTCAINTERAQKAAGYMKDANTCTKTTSQAEHPMVNHASLVDLRLLTIIFFVTHEN